jgi:hypothetical protein
MVAMRVSPCTYAVDGPYANRNVAVLVLRLLFVVGALVGSEGVQIVRYF